MYASVVRCEPVRPSKATEDAKMNLNAYSKFLEQYFMERIYDCFLAKHKALNIWNQ